MPDRAKHPAGDGEDGAERARDPETRLRDVLEKLQESQEHLRLLIDHAPAALALFDRDMRYLAASRRWMEDFGLQGKEVLGRSHYEIFPEIPEAWRQVHRRALEGESARAEEDPFQRADGRVQWERWEVLPWRQPDGAVGGIVIFSEDVTARKEAEAERRRMEQELDHLQRLDSLGRLAGGVAHDMNNVLGAIMAVASALQERHPEDAAIAGDAELILQAAARGRDLAQGLRDFSRKELDSAGALDLNELARREAELLERTTQKRTRIELRLEPGLPAVFGESGSIRNAIMNLCLNAMDAMVPGGTLTLASRDVGHGFVELAVEDTGEGMPPEVAARALEPFFTTKPAGKGTGLGLSRVYGTVKAHGGTLDLHSEVGKGTRVAMRFPCLGGVVLGAPADPAGP
jgi:PAS domain S-box-containing protein